MAHQELRHNLKESGDDQESFGDQMQAFNDATLGRSFGKPRYSRDLMDENPNALWIHQPVGGSFDGFHLINRDEIALVNAGELKREDTAMQKVMAANSAEERLRKALWRGESFNEKDLQFTARQFKIHFQPKKEFVPDVFSKLIEAFKDDDDLRALVPAFKSSIAQEVVKDDNGQPVPEIVLYLPSYDAMRKAVEKLETYLAEDAYKGSGATPRFNWKINDLMYVAQSGADFKNALHAKGLLDEYYDKNYNYAVRKGVRIYSREHLAIIDAPQNFVELFQALDALGGLMGSDQLYRVAELKTRINAVREGKEEISAITSSGGLRTKVQDLLKQENK